MATDHSRFLSDIDDGRLREVAIEAYLMREALTAGQKKFLADHSLTVTMVLNGHYGSQDEVAVLDWMRSVNSTLGGKLFTIV